MQEPAAKIFIDTKGLCFPICDIYYLIRQYYFFSDAFWFTLPFTPRTA